MFFSVNRNYIVNNQYNRAVKWKEEKLVETEDLQA